MSKQYRVQTIDANGMRWTAGEFDDLDEAERMAARGWHGLSHDNAHNAHVVTVRDTVNGCTQFAVDDGNAHGFHPITGCNFDIDEDEA